MILSHQIIWKSKNHAAFTDLFKFKENIYCAFREGATHHHETNGIIHLLASHQGVIFNEIAVLEVEGWDLRDPKFSTTPTGELMLLIGASKHDREGERLDFKTLVSFSKDGKNWSLFQPVLNSGEWLWRVTWFQGIGYGISYTLKKFREEGTPFLNLYKTSNGLDYEIITPLFIRGSPSEATIRFKESHEMVILQRRDGIENDHAWIGRSFPPYQDFLWSETSIHLGGPNFIILPNGKMVAAARAVFRSPYYDFEKTVVLSMEENDFEIKLFLPGLGDTGYPGLHYENSILYVSYYVQEGNFSTINLAKIAVIEGA